MDSKTLFVLSLIFSELNLKSSFRTMFYTLMSFIDSDSNKATIPINTIIGILNRRNLSDASNRRRVCAELDRYVSSEANATEIRNEMVNFLNTTTEKVMGYPLIMFLMLVQI